MSALVMAACQSLAPPGGGNDSYTKLLLHLDGADGATGAPDISASGHSFGFFGNAQLDTDQSRFGGASLRLDGSGDLVSAPDSADWAFGSGDFTIDFWVRHNTFPPGTGWPSPSNFQNYITQRAGTASNPWWVIDFENNNGSLSIRMVTSTGAANTTIFRIGVTMTTGTWYHVAIVRSGSTFMLFLNGALQGTATYGSAVQSVTGPLEIGRWMVADGRYFNGWLDEFRISKGIARWTASFIAPSRAYT